MKRTALVLVCLATAAPMASTANAKGCIKGAIVGGIAGHMAGHGLVGAAGGCAVGHHMAKTKANRDAASQVQDAPVPTSK